MDPNEQLEVLGLVYAALRRADLPAIDDVTMDNDNNDGEIILTAQVGGKERTFVISSSSIMETDLVC
jgi:hypothetical protein